MGIGRSVKVKSIVGFERCNSLTGSQTFGGFGVVNPLPSRHELAQVKSLQTPRPTTVHLHHDRASPGSAQELIGKVIKLLHLGGWAVSSMNPPAKELAS